MRVRYWTFIPNVDEPTTGYLLYLDDEWLWEIPLPSPGDFIGIDGLNRDLQIASRTFVTAPRADNNFAWVELELNPIPNSDIEYYRLAIGAGERWVYEEWDGGREREWRRYQRSTSGEKDSE